MDLLLIANNNTNANAVHLSALTHFPGQSDLLGWCQDMSIGTSILLGLMGAVYLLYGWNQFKWLITINAAIIGGYIGAAVGSQYGYPVGGGALGSIVAAGMTMPLMKWAVAVMGGICGALFGAALWRTAGLEPQLAWAGAMTGLVGFGLLSFILFRGSIIMYTSLQGAMMIILGMLGLMCKHAEIMPKITQALNAQPYVLPILVFVPAILGLIYQQTHTGGAPAAGGGDKKK
jgi:hypothetical protein